MLYFVHGEKPFCSSSWFVYFTNMSKSSRGRVFFEIIIDLDTLGLEKTMYQMCVLILLLFFCPQWKTFLWQFLLQRTPTEGFSSKSRSSGDHIDLDTVRLYDYHNFFLAIRFNNCQQRITFNNFIQFQFEMFECDSCILLIITCTWWNIHLWKYTSLAHMAF